jgi:hypothetical protein
MQRCRANDDEIADFGLQIEKQNVVLTIRNPQSPIRNFKGATDVPHRYNRSRFTRTYQHSRVRAFRYLQRKRAKSAGCSGWAAPF